MLGQYMNGIGYGMYTSFNDTNLGQFGGIDPFASIRGSIFRFQDIKSANVAAANSSLTDIVDTANDVLGTAGVSAAAKSTASRLINTASAAKGRSFNDIKMAFRTLSSRLRKYDNSQPGGESVAVGGGPAAPGAPGAPVGVSPKKGGGGGYIVGLVLVALLAGGGWWYYTTQMA